MSNYKEIVTKTIIGKGKKIFSENYTIETEEIPNTVLGCWIINHKFKGNNKQNEVNINGSYDVNIWYSYDDNSKTGVTTKTYYYDNSMKLKVKNMDSLNNNNEIIVECLNQPTVKDVKIVDNKVELNIEKELGVEIVGEGKVKIAFYDEELPWDDLYNEDSIEDVNEDYLKEDVN